jgi:hypothetical protein
MLGSLLPILSHCVAKAGLFCSIGEVRNINSNILPILLIAVNRHVAYDSVDITLQLPPSPRQSYMHGIRSTLGTWYKYGSKKVEKDSDRILPGKFVRAIKSPRGSTTPKGRAIIVLCTHSADTYMISTLNGEHAEEVLQRSWATEGVADHAHPFLLCCV